MGVRAMASAPPSARASEKILDQAGHPHSLFMQTPENGAVFIGFARTHQRHFNLSAQQRDGRAQLMRGVAGEGAHAGEGFVDAFEHLIEGAGEIGISSFALGTGRRMSRLRSLMRRASAAIAAIGLSALRLMK